MSPFGGGKQQVRATPRTPADLQERERLVTRDVYLLRAVSTAHRPKNSATPRYARTMTDARVCPPNAETPDSEDSLPRDEPRAPRPGGRRHSSVAWRALARSSNALQATGPAALAMMTGRVNLAVRTFSVLGSTGSVASRMARRQAAPQADAIEDFDHLAQSVLFLRAFSDDRAPFSQSDARHDRRPVERQLAFLWSDPDEEFLSFERYLGPELSRRVGPMIGLGSPDDRLPPEGPVTRHYAADENWIVKVGLLVRAVRCIVMLPQITASLNDELGIIHNSHMADKLFVITSPYTAAGEGQTGMLAPLRLRLGRAAVRARTTPWLDLVAAFNMHELILPRSHPGPGCVIGFDVDGRAMVLTSGATRARDYVDALVRALPPGA
jgi:hypothetical protein